jgi:beta-1,2-mannobiose phosphorylase / 1,2-beta-oligomannan phosphorylase
VQTASSGTDFAAVRFGVIMSSEAGDPREAWGVLNPGGVRSSDGVMHLFPRIVAEGNFSRIGDALVRYEAGKPVGVERVGLALEPKERFEVGPAGGGVEDPRVVYMPLLNCFVMTYTAYVPHEPRIAIAVSQDLLVWQRLGVVRFEAVAGGPDLNECGNKDAAFFPDVIADPEGVPSLGILHRPTTRIRFDYGGSDVTKPPSGEETRESIWISYVAVDAVLADITGLASVRRHERIMAPEQSWESEKVGTGAPPVRLPYGWVVPYHAVSAPTGQPIYCMGIVILDLQRPSRVLYRTPSPVLEPQTEYERSGIKANVVFPTATDLRADGQLDVFYGAADSVIAAARVTLPSRLPST